MKKSFKKVVAILLAVMMMVCSFPLTALAADDASRANVKIRFGALTCSSSSTKSYTLGRKMTLDKVVSYSGLNSNELNYSNGKISDYTTGDYFTASVLLENVSELSAAEVAVQYSPNIQPVYFLNTSQQGVNPFVEYDKNNLQQAYQDLAPGEALLSQSGNKLYNGDSSTVGETSYVDADNHVMHANFSVQNGADSVSTASINYGKLQSTNTAVLATFAFKIVADGAITFNIQKSDDPLDTYYLATIANGGKTEEYKTYAKVSETDVPALDFMGENEYNGPSVKTYTITFVDADGQQISAESYNEGTAIVAPQLPAVTHDNDKHYTYAWDKEIPETATADGTYTMVKTGAAHTWDAGVVTTEPTTESTGVKTYTCTLDGCGATKTETLPKVEQTHVHTWSEWTYNNDAVYNRNPDIAKDGTATRTCTDPNCPTHATETKTIEGSKYLGFYGKTVTLSAAVTLNLVFDNTITTKFDQVYAEVLYSGVPYKLDEITAYSGNLVKYDFEKIGPKNFDSPLKIQLCGVTSEGIVCKSDVLNYSIKTYLYNQLSKNPKPNLKKLLIETLYYGEADKLFNNMSATLTNELSAEQKAIHTNDVPAYVKQNETIANPNPTPMDINWYGMSLALSGAVYVSFYLTVPSGKSISDYNFKFNIDGKEEVYNYKTHKECFTSQGNNNWCLDYKGVGSHQYGKSVTAIAYDATTGVQVSPTRIYSVESYTYSGAYGRSSSLKALVDQILRYGRANIAYRANPNA